MWARTGVPADGGPCSTRLAAGGQNGVWVVNNRCDGDACRLTGFIAQEYRQVCTARRGRLGDMNCTNERPFLEVYGACPSGHAERRPHRAHDRLRRRCRSDIQTTYLDEGRCYAPSTDPNDAPGQDVTGTYSASYWRFGSNRPIVGFRLNALPTARSRR